MFVAITAFIIDALTNSTSNISLSADALTTVDGFILDTQSTLSFLHQNRQNDAIRRKSRFPSKLYNLTDVVNTRQRSIKLFGFYIETTVLTIYRKRYLQIMSSGGMDSFLVAVDLSGYQTANFSAYILNLYTEPTLSGTESMLLIHYILSRLGVKQSKLQNTARLRYQFRATSDGKRQNAFIPMICLRCTKGKLSDWYDEFGYSNNNKWQIAQEMQKIHNMPLPVTSNCSFQSFGPWLLSLWNQPDKYDFHQAFQSTKNRFNELLKLRDDRNSPWIADIR